MNMQITHITSEKAEGNHVGESRTSKMSQVSQMWVHLLFRTHQKLEQKALKGIQPKHTGRKSLIPAKYTRN